MISSSVCFFLAISRLILGLVQLARGKEDGRNPTLACWVFGRKGCYRRCWPEGPTGTPIMILSACSRSPMIEWCWGGGGGGVGGLASLIACLTVT